MAARPDEALPIERLAVAAALPPFHFRRVWTAMMGETVAETRRRIRTQRAAADLLRGRLALPRVARRSGSVTTILPRCLWRRCAAMRGWRRGRRWPAVAR